MTAGMKWIGKSVGALLGWLAAGPVGAAMGLLLGHQIDIQGFGASSPEELRGIGERFFRATFHVMGYLAKADGRVSEAEIAAARAIMAELHLSGAQVQLAIDCYTEGKQPRFDVAAELAALAQALRGRPDLTRVFLEIQVRAALAGNDLGGPVRALLNRVAAALRVSPFELAHIEAVLRIQRGGFRAAGAGAGGRDSAGAGRSGDLAEAYKVLDAVPEASDSDIVKAYRRQLSRHHPDKLKARGLPDSMMAHAKRRTQQIIEAYDLIRERRGMT
jgi:DnaJ like chaperone protein